MPRRTQTETKHDYMYGRWQIFGEWLTHQRLLAGFTQTQVAQAIGVSRRQWIRYELGAKVPVKRMDLMSRVLNIHPDRMLDRAGYRTSFKRHAVKEQLGRISDLLSAGRLQMAMLSLLKLNDRIMGIKAAAGPRLGLNGTDYTHALVLLNRLPTLYVDSLQNLMQERTKDREKKDKEIRDESYLNGKNRLRKKTKDVMLWGAPSL
ncbi:MAG: helix-turn-helix transcriptional regulator [Pyrinomonadaceae bacterium]